MDQMSRDKQIEEIARTIAHCGICIYQGDVCTRNEEVSDPLALCIARVLNMAGYRKASDVALETVDSFQRILRHIFLNMCNGNDYERLNLLQIDGAIEALYDSFIAELKKKYESEGEG